MKAILGLLVALFGIFAIIGCNKSESELKVWNIYKGELATYRVKIDESMRGGVYERLIHLEPINGYEEPTPKPFAMTGHDYNGDGRFERIFIRERSIDGYNAVSFTDKSERAWEPCYADKNKMQPFTDIQIASTQSQLYLAMVIVHNQDHLVSTLKSFKTK